ncbi:MAG: hypothetical protein M3Z66_22385, partial [Chloroflexota bacterium]|nr:hypothetical protein [Chloroflexota bacterium]
IYTTANSTLARRLLRLYHVRFVVVGDTERTAYPGPPIGLDKFSRFMRVAFRRFGTIVYSW